MILFYASWYCSTILISPALVLWITKVVSDCVWTVFEVHINVLQNNNDLANGYFICFIIMVFCNRTKKVLILAIFTPIEKHSSLFAYQANPISYRIQFNFNKVSLNSKPFYVLIRKYSDYIDFIYIQILWFFVSLIVSYP